MSENFSKRNGLVNAKLLIEDIPISVRASFAKEILAECYLDIDYGLDSDCELDFSPELIKFDSAPLAYLARHNLAFHDLIFKICIAVDKEFPKYQGGFIYDETDFEVAFWDVNSYETQSDWQYFDQKTQLQVKMIYRQQYEYLIGIFRALTWYEFYDVMEIIIQDLHDKLLMQYKQYYQDAQEISEIMGDPSVEFYKKKPEILFDHFLEVLNRWFDKNHIGWNVNPSGKLNRKFSEHQKPLILAVDTGLREKFPAAHVHFLKAKQYCFMQPLDPENTIKEIITALESLGKNFYPTAKTLTYIKKEMQKKEDIPAAITDLLSTFYAYTNEESGIRHGQPRKPNVKIADAELCFYLGSALINYLLQDDHLIQEEFDKG